MAHNGHIPQLTVAAETHADVQATIGTLTIDVTAVAPAAPAAHERRRNAVDTVRQVLDLVPDLVVRNEAVRDSDDRDDRYHGEQGSPKYRAFWSIDLVADLSAGEHVHEQMREAVSRLSGVDDVRVSGPRWSLDPHTARSVRTSAMADALVAAAEQADVMVKPFGQRTGRVLDAKMNLTAHRGILDAPVIGARQAEAMSAMGSPPERTLDLDLTPADETVTAEVTATFELIDG